MKEAYKLMPPWYEIRSARDRSTPTKHYTSKDFKQADAMEGLNSDEEPMNRNSTTVFSEVF